MLLVNSKINDPCAKLGSKLREPSWQQAKRLVKLWTSLDTQRCKTDAVRHRFTQIPRARILRISARIARIALVAALGLSGVGED